MLGKKPIHQRTSWHHVDGIDRARLVSNLHATQDYLIQEACETLLGLRVLVYQFRAAVVAWSYDIGR